jgi:hypothetical protein
MGRDELQDLCLGKDKGKVVSVLKYRSVNTCGGVEVRFHELLTSALGRGELSSSRYCIFTGGE